MCEITNMQTYIFVYDNSYPQWFVLTFNIAFITLIGQVIVLSVFQIFFVIIYSK